MTKKSTAAAKSMESVAAKADAAAAKDPVNSALSKEEKIELFRKMMRIRRFEERTLRVYQQGKIGGFLHLYIGQEAIAVGTTSLMGSGLRPRSKLLSISDEMLSGISGLEVTGTGAQGRGSDAGDQP